MYRFTSKCHNQTTRQSIVRAEITRAKKRFLHPLLTSKPTTMTRSAQTTIPPYQH